MRKRRGVRFWVGSIGIGLIIRRRRWWAQRSQRHHIALGTPPRQSVHLPLLL
jgi:hypothetical protein